MNHYFYYISTLANLIYCIRELAIKFLTKLLTAEVAGVVLLLLFFGLQISSVRAQQDAISDSLLVSDSLDLDVSQDSINYFPSDSLFIADTSYIDTTRLINTPDSLAKIEPYGSSPNAVTARIDYKADDSLRLDMRTQRVYMYKNSDINYEDINLKADYVEIEFVSKTVFARGTEDSLGKLVGRPIFTMADNSFPLNKKERPGKTTASNIIISIL